MKVAIIQQVYKSRRYLEPVYAAIAAQTHKDIEVFCQIVDDDGGCKEFIQKNYPSIKILEPGYNIGFSRGHNEIFASSDAEFFQLVNPDLILEPNHVEEMLKVFADPKAGAATGKLLRYNFDENKATNIIDTTGVIAYKTGRARDRGQHEVDNGQYDNQTDLISVSGAGPMYRKAALESVKYKNAEGRFEYFDESFHSYWEDVDLGWRMVNVGWKCKFVPSAVAYHGRQAGSSPGGYKKFFAFVKFHSKMNPRIRQLNYKNHIFMFIKNSPKWYPKFFLRELFMLGFVTVFETSTLKIIPTLFRQLPGIWQKRKYIKEHRKISVADMEKLFASHPTDL